MSRIAALLFACVGLAFATNAPAWELETHVGLTDRAAHASRLDAWLRAHGLTEGLYETLGLQRRGPGTSPARELDDRELLDELDRVDAALGVSPDGARQPALAWLLSGAVLEGARMDRVRNHFLNPRDGGGLSEAGTGSARARLEAMRDGSGSVRGIFTGANFDGTGMRADRWIDASENELSRTRFLDELERAASAETENARQAALARALVAAGALAHLLEAVGDPAHARGDFTVNYALAGAPLERWAVERYGLAVPPPVRAGSLRPVPSRLAWFLSAPDGSGLGDEIGRSFLSPGTLPESAGALPLPSVQAGAASEGMLPGPFVKSLVAYHRDANGTHYDFTQNTVAEAVDFLLPRIARRTAQLLDFLFRDVIAIVPGDDGAFHVDVGPTALEHGRIALFIEQLDGRRTAIIDRATQGGSANTALLNVSADEAHAFAGARKIVAFYRGKDANGEAVVGYVVATPQR